MAVAILVPIGLVVFPNDTSPQEIGTKLLVRVATPHRLFQAVRRDAAIDHVARRPNTHTPPSIFLAMWIGVGVRLWLSLRGTSVTTQLSSVFS